MIKLSNRPMWQTAIAPAVLMLICAIAAAAIGPGGIFMIGFMAVLTLMMLTLCWIAVNFVAGTRYRWRESGVAAALIVATLVMSYASFNVAAGVRFMTWSASNRLALHQSLAKDGLIPEWYRSGATGMDRGSYLAVDVRDEISSLPAAQAWRQRLGLPCEIVAARRLMERVFLISTGDCRIDVAPAVERAKPSSIF